MIPTVEDILKMLLARQCTHEQAMAWMEEHFAAAIEQGERQSLESVRSEALEEAARLVESYTHIGATEIIAHKIRALSKENVHLTELRK